MTHHGNVALVGQPGLLLVQSWTANRRISSNWGSVFVDERVEVQPGANYQAEKLAVHFGPVVEPIFEWVTFDQQEITRGLLEGTGSIEGEPVAHFLGDGSFIGIGSVTGEAQIIDAVYEDPPELTSPEFTEAFSSRSLYDRDRERFGSLPYEYNEYPNMGYIVGMGSDKFVLMRVETSGYIVFELYYLGSDGPHFKSGFQVFIGGESIWDAYASLTDWHQIDWTKHNYSESEEHADHQLFNISDDRAIYVFNDGWGNIRFLDFKDIEGVLSVQKKVLLNDVYLGIPDEETGWITDGSWVNTSTPSFASTMAWMGENGRLFVLVNAQVISWPLPEDIERQLELYLMEFDIDNPTGTPVEARWIDVPRTYYQGGDYLSGWMARFFFQVLDVKSDHVDLGGLDDYSGTIGTGASIVATRLNLTTLEFADIGMLIDFEEQPFNYWSWLTHNIAANDHGYVYAHSDIINWTLGNIIYYYTLSKDGRRTNGVYMFSHIDVGENNGQIGFLDTKLAWNSPPYLKDRVMMSVWNNTAVETEQWGVYYDYVWTVYTFTFDGVNLILEEVNTPTLKGSPIFVYEDIGPILYPVSESFIAASGSGFTLEPVTEDYLYEWPLILFQTNTHTFTPIGGGTVFTNELRLNQRDD